MNLQSSKNLGIIGALLIVIAALAFLVNPYGGLLGLVGVILLLISLKGMSNYYKEDGIFNNGLYAVIISIVGAVVCAAVIVETFLSSGISDLNQWAKALQQNATAGDFNAVWSQVSHIITGFVVSLVLLYVFVIVAAVLCWRSLNKLAAKSEVGMFKRAALLLLIGAVLTIVLVGVILIWIAFILIAVAFFSVKTAAPPPSAPPPTMSPPPPG